MHYTKNGTIPYKIVKHNDILAIADYFEKLCQNDYGSTTFTIRYYDNTTIEDTNKSIFTSGVFNRKDIKNISFVYESLNHKNYVRLALAEELCFSKITNTYEIISWDEKWYNATLAQITELINTIQNTHRIRRIFGFPGILMSLVAFVLLASFVMDGPLGFDYGEQTESAVTFIPGSVFYGSIFILFTIIAVVTIFLFPEMEFYLEMPRSNKRKKVRGILLWIIGTIAIPVVLSLII